MPGSDIRLLSLDGGGVRGLSALMILEQLMEAINPDAPPKPCDYFDMIGGTSTGGLIAIMLGRLKMSISDCIDAYLLLSEQVFQKKRHRVSVKGKIQGRFDSQELERVVKETITAQGLNENSLLKEDNAVCKVFVCATSKETSDTVCLTSHNSSRGGRDLLNSVKIWEACRATSAASSFFDPIAIGRYKEEFVDGATGANNPVMELWNQAQLIWGPESLESKVQCLVSIGTGIPSLKPFKDDVFHIGETLLAISTETEQTAERFQRDKASLDSNSRYFRFNVIRGLEDIGLEESKKTKEIAAATRRYISSQGVVNQMQACAKNLSRREYIGVYGTDFNLKGVPKVKEFVDRPAEMAELEQVLLPQRQRQKIFVLHGMGGIGKTQLAVEFARQHHRRFSSIFWLDGSSEDNLKLSLANCASRITKGQISETSREYAPGRGVDINVVVTEVMRWLAKPENTEWLLVFDNVDREYGLHTSDPLAYDIKEYFSGADHGAILITTRLASLGQLGASQQLIKVSRAQAQAILKSWYKKDLDPNESDWLYSLLDGLPLAIAQAGAYLKETEVGLSTYLKYYEQQWDKLIQTGRTSREPLQDYPNRSVGTTWSISYNSIREQNEAAANLLLLWSFLDNKSLWYGLFAEARSASAGVARELEEWMGDVASDELEFVEAMRLLCSYSMVEGIEDSASYATHPIVHKWTYHQGQNFSPKLTHLAVLVVGWAVPKESMQGYSGLDRQLLPHAQICLQWIVTGNPGIDIERVYTEKDGNWNNKLTLGAFDSLGNLFYRRGKPVDAEQLCQRALQGKEKVLGPDHTWTLQTVNNLGIVYKNQGKLVEAEQLYQRALQGYQKALGPDHMLILHTVNNLGLVYKDQGKLVEAEQLYQRALQGYQKALGPDHMLILHTVNNLGLVYNDQGKLVEAEQLYQRALQGYQKALGPDHTSTLGTVNNLGSVYNDQGKLVEAEQLYQRALQGCQKALGPDHTSTLGTVNNLGSVYNDQGKLVEAEQLYQRALQGYQKSLGPVQVKIYNPALDSIQNLANLYARTGRLVDAHDYYTRAIDGLTVVLGPSSQRCKDLIDLRASLPSAEGDHIHVTTKGEPRQMANRSMEGVPVRDKSSKNGLKVKMKSLFSKRNG